MAIDRDGEGPPLRKAQAGADDASALRATPFTEDVFDDDYYRGRGRSTGGSPFGLIVGVIVGAAVAGGAAWFVLKDQNIGTLTASGDTAVIKADPSPYKIKPENPGGMQVENQDKTVYDRVAKTDAPNRVENLLPAPEKPKTPPKAEPKPEPKTAPVETKVPEAKPAETTVETKVAETPPAKTAEQEKKDDLAVMISALEGKTPAQPNTAQPEPTPEPVKTADKSPEAMPTALQPTAPQPAPTDAPKELAPAAPAMTGTGTFQVQLAAAKSEEGAMTEWNRIKNRHPALLGSLTPSVVRADLGDKGVFYRLRAGFLADKAASDTLCAALTAQGDACLVIKP